MRPSAALERHQIDVLRTLAHRYKTTNIRVFGSVLEGREVDESDLDLLVDPLPGATLFNLGALKAEFEEILGVTVDLLTPGDVPAHFRTHLVASAKAI